MSNTASLIRHVSQHIPHSSCRTCHASYPHPISHIPYSIHHVAPYPHPISHIPYLSHKSYHIPHARRAARTHSVTFALIQISPLTPRYIISHMHMCMFVRRTRHLRQWARKSHNIPYRIPHVAFTRQTSYLIPHTTWGRGYEILCDFHSHVKPHTSYLIQRETCIKTEVHDA